MKCENHSELFVCSKCSPGIPPSSTLEMRKDLVCRCGHSVDSHCYEVSGLLKPWCDECSCKVFIGGA